jgi:hypothetical protein
LCKFAFTQVEVIDNFSDETELRLYKQRSIFLGVHTNGFELGFRWGKLPTIKRYVFQEVEFLQIQHPKFTYRTGTLQTSFFQRRYMYGVLNETYALRYGWGMLNIINEKPYWGGGLSVSWFFAGGADLVLAIPQYLSVFYQTAPVDPLSNNWYEFRDEKYNPDNPQHSSDFIISRGKIGEGLIHLRPYPGIYVKLGLHLDFGKYQERLHAIEVGAMGDFFPMPIPIMAHSPKTWFYWNFYITYHFGWRK